jgi:exodeoxyribonuclease VII small subunit
MTDPADDHVAETGAPMTATGQAIADLTFDDALAELQRTVADLETGGLTLERTLALHERGVALLEHSERMLRTAELRMQQLITRPGGRVEAVDVAIDDTPAEP